MGTTVLVLSLIIGWALYFIMSRPEPDPPTKGTDQS